MPVPDSLLKLFPPDASGLLKLVSLKIDDAMLREIAEADYGCDAEKHEIAIRAIRESGIVTSPQPWHPGEVLELLRYSQPDDPAWKPGSTGIRGHWMRLFCCAALMRSEQGRILQESTVAQALASASRFDASVNRAMGCALTAAISATTERQEWITYVGELLVALRVQCGLDVIRSTCEWIGNDVDAQDALAELQSFDSFGQEEGYYEPLVQELRAYGVQAGEDEVRHALESIASTLSRR